MMSPRTKWTLGIAAGVLALWGAWRALHRPSGHAGGKDEDPGMILDRVWVDRMPERYTDYVHAMLAVSGAPLGIFQKASNYDIHAEIFEYKRDGGRMKLRFPQDGRTAELTFHVRACDAPPPFDLCLDLSKNPWGGPKRYYGLREADAEARLLGPLARALHERAAGQVPTQ